jgi:hypothetical protein
VKSFPLQTLLKVREHREKRALQVVAEQKAQLESRLREMQAVSAKLDALRAEQAALATRLLGSGGNGLSVAGLANIDARRALLRDQAVAVSEELEVARRAVERARASFSESVRAYRQLRAKKDSTLVQRDAWLAREQQQADQRDELLAEDLIMSRYVRTERPQ